MSLDYAELLQRGVALSQAGRHEEALVVYDNILAVFPDHPDALNNRGIALAQMRRYEEALASFDRTLAIQPNSAEALRNRGTALEETGNSEGALASFSKALEFKPDFIDALLSRGRLLVRLGRKEEGVANLDRILAIEPSHAEALNSRAVALMNLGRHEEALSGFDRAFAVAPASAGAMNDCGSVLINLRRYREALARFEKALEMKQDFPEALNNRGLALGKLLRHEASLECFDHALRIRPDFVAAFDNRGIALAKLGRFEDALESDREALKIQPDFAKAHLHQGITLLRMGDFHRGLRKYEWRWLDGGSSPPWREFPQPLWMGRDDLGGKTILLHAEQGLGDTLQFVRYVPMVAARGATVCLGVPPVLAPLMRGLKGVDRILAWGEPVPMTDFHCPLLSLPLAFDTTLETIPAPIPYLSVDRARAKETRKKLAPRGGRLVGVCWSGNPSHHDDHERSIRFEEFAALLSVPGVQFVSLQKEVRGEDVSAIKRANLVDLAAELGDYGDTAAAISLLDLVISVDTSVAHLAGALGKPVWILLPYSADWRWLVGREDSPWYPSARLFRQSTIGDWASVIRNVRDKLARRPASRRQSKV